MSVLFLSTTVLLYLYFCLSVVSSAKNQVRTKVMVFEDEVTNCDDKDYVLSIGPFSVSRVGLYMLINGKVAARRDLLNPISFKFRIEKCGDKGNPNSCEYYTTWKWDDACTTLNVLPFTKSFYNSHVPKLNACPYKKSVYEIRNYTVRSDTMLNLFPTGGNSLWKFRVTFKDKTEEIISCVKCSFRFATIRKKL
ncbi:unnamed protein product [Bemisia tabaci]|uniref:MD-2-related lipid-recognition domain-containing protein n=1 Tax=Bemisia tabaci TaxID=7038 RepID=A0A9P0EZ76_BEMTA|nr:unnamed protein product [Bemisia tabaci]